MLMFTLYPLEKTHFQTLEAFRPFSQMVFKPVPRALQTEGVHIFANF